MKDLRDLQDRLIQLQKELLMRARDLSDMSTREYNSYYELGYKDGCLDAAAILAEEFAKIDNELNTSESPF